SLDALLSPLPRGRRPSILNIWVTRWGIDGRRRRRVWHPADPDSRVPGLPDGDRSGGDPAGLQLRRGRADVAAGAAGRRRDPLQPADGLRARGRGSDRHAGPPDPGRARGLLLAASPWIFGFAWEVWIPHVVLGLAEVGAAMFTQTRPSHRAQP